MNIDRTALQIRVHVKAELCQIIVTHAKFRKWNETILVVVIYMFQHWFESIASRQILWYSFDEIQTIFGSHNFLWNIHGLIGKWLWFVIELNERAEIYLLHNVSFMEKCMFLSNDKTNCQAERLHKRQMFSRELHARTARTTTIHR